MRLLPAIALISLALLAGCGAESNDEAGSTLPSPPPTSPPPTPTAGPPPLCSASGLQLTLPDQELPPAVADVRKRIFDAAIVCDYDALEQIALEQGAGFTFSYGAGTDASEHWRDVEESSSEEPKPMRALATILTLPYTRNESGSYAWPTAYDESPTDEDWQALVDAGLYDAAAIDQMKTQATGYLGYRTAITADGDWQFFVAGD